MTRKEAHIFWVAGLVLVVILAVIVFLPRDEAKVRSTKAASTERLEPPEAEETEPVTEPSEPDAPKEGDAADASQPKEGDVVTTIAPVAGSKEAIEEAKTADKIEDSEHVKVERPETATSPTSTVDASTEKTHVVQKGDNLTNIARRYYGSGSPDNMNRIVRANQTVLKAGIKTMLFPGMKLVIPGVEGSAPAVKPPEPTQPTGVTYHVVKKGDSLYTIAKKHLGSGSQENIQKILKANPDIKDPDTIKEGQKIAIPKE